VNETTYKIDDNVIAHIARLLQVSMLTGTDIVDHIRMIRLKSGEDSNLILDNDYAEVFDVSLDKMIENANERNSKEG
tara:strand:+ start:146 stop:376 length:231 start_codon:yes stop_codon:yes gene_type:complete